MKQSRLTTILCGVMLIISAVLFVGSFTFIKTCGPMEDGSWMTCHWAGRAITAVSCVMTVLSLISIIAKNIGVKLGLTIGTVANAVICALLPGRIISTCMMSDMQCNAVTKPVTAVLCIAVAVIGVINVMINVKNIKETK